MNFNTVIPVDDVNRIGGCMKMHVRPITVVLVALSLLTIAGMVLAAKARSNCGGNSAALAACRNFIAILESWQAKNPSSRFQYDELDMQTRFELSHLPGARRVRSGRFLADVKDVRLDPTKQKRIIMVCDRPFDNVPLRIFKRAPMKHAVAYSTGESGLISTTEFAKLDLNAFVDLQSLATTNRLGLIQ